LHSLLARAYQYPWFTQFSARVVSPASKPAPLRSRQGQSQGHCITQGSSTGLRLPLYDPSRHIHPAFWRTMPQMRFFFAEEGARPPVGFYTPGTVEGDGGRSIRDLARDAFILVRPGTEVPPFALPAEVWEFGVGGIGVPLPGVNGPMTADLDYLWDQACDNITDLSERAHPRKCLVIRVPTGALQVAAPQAPLPGAQDRFQYQGALPSLSASYQQVFLDLLPYMSSVPLVLPWRIERAPLGRLRGLLAPFQIHFARENRFVEATRSVLSFLGNHTLRVTENNRDAPPHSTGSDYELDRGPPRDLARADQLRTILMRGVAKKGHTLTDAHLGQVMKYTVNMMADQGRSLAYGFLLCPTFIQVIRVTRGRHGGLDPHRSIEKSARLPIRSGLNWLHTLWSQTPFDLGVGLPEAVYNDVRLEYGPQLGRGGSSSVFQCGNVEGCVVKVSRSHRGLGEEGRLLTRMARLVPPVPHVPILVQSWPRMLLLSPMGGRVMPGQWRAALAIQLLEVLGNLHDNGIYHRDIRPGNILIGDDGNLLLIDFGAAVRVDVPDTPSLGPFAGASKYASPEVMGRLEMHAEVEFSRRDDLFSFVASCYVLSHLDDALIVMDNKADDDFKALRAQWRLFLGVGEWPQMVEAAAACDSDRLRQLCRLCDAQ
ncbi:hypothetical protein KIPB_003720, partial [Kipferlia bialata]